MNTLLVKIQGDKVVLAKTFDNFMVAVSEGIKWIKTESTLVPISEGDLKIMQLCLMRVRGVYLDNSKKTGVHILIKDKTGEYK